MVAARSARLTAAELTAAATLVLASLYTARFYDPRIPSIATYTGAGTSLLAIMFSIVAFALSIRIRSRVVACSLIVGGVVMQIPPLQAIAEAGVIAVPGPILGVVFFAPVLVFGVVKAIGLGRKAVRGRTADGGYSVAVSTASRLCREGKERACTTRISLPLEGACYHGSNTMAMWSEALSRGDLR